MKEPISYGQQYYTALSRKNQTFVKKTIDGEKAMVAEQPSIEQMRIIVQNAGFEVSENAKESDMIKALNGGKAVKTAKESDKGN